MNKIRVPQSKFRRELNKWFRYINADPLNVVYITVNSKDTVVFISPEHYNQLIGSIKKCQNKESVLK